MDSKKKIVKYVHIYNILPYTSVKYLTDCLSFLSNGEVVKYNIFISVVVIHVERLKRRAWRQATIDKEFYHTTFLLFSG